MFLFLFSRRCNASDRASPVTTTGNPKLEVLFPLIRALKIDPREIFNPEFQRDSPSLRQLRLIIEDCSEEEAAVLIPVFNSMLAALRENKNTYAIK